MAQTESSRAEAKQHVLLNEQELEWQLVRSSVAKKMRIKVGPDGVKVVLPKGRDDSEAAAFVVKNGAWVAQQLERTRKLLAARIPRKRPDGCILFRGETVAARVVVAEQRRAPNKVEKESNAITITIGPRCKTPASRSLENWMRKQARERIEHYVSVVGKRLKRRPNRIYIMDQRTKWGSCSALSNLSFNWRLIKAPDFVLRYIVTHEMVHLSVPDHSSKFWLMVQSLCADTERARQWLAAKGHLIQRGCSLR